MVDKVHRAHRRPPKDPGGAAAAGSDVHRARLWNFWPILELEKDKTYRLHLQPRWTTTTAFDQLQPANINIQVVPGL